MVLSDEYSSSDEDEIYFEDVMACETTPGCRLGTECFDISSILPVSLNANEIRLEASTCVCASPGEEENSDDS